MPLLVSLADARDSVIIVYGVVGIVFFFIAAIMALVIGLTLRGLIKSLRSVVEESVKPAVDSIKETADTVRGTTDFVGRKAISPIIRTYGAFAGVRKGLSVLGGIKGNGRRGR